MKWSDFWVECLEQLEDDEIYLSMEQEKQEKVKKMFKKKWDKGVSVDDAVYDIMVVWG